MITDEEADLIARKVVAALKPTPAPGGMQEATREMNEALIRLCKGIVSAWERWLSRQ